ncbi:ATP-dependent helicase [Candidatus Uhrbacteria bacterium]|nr:ATP-dependent helicase [Candidatus Uhrbacteria bacterium]
MSSRLNPQQQTVVDNAEGPCLVLAGAGSGKTKTIVHRVARLLETGISPWHILLLTFTNKAANEMMARCEAMFGASSRQIWGGTFHHIGNRILRQHAQDIGFTSRFTILDEDDRKRLLKQSLKQFGEAPERPLKPEVVGSIVSAATNTMVAIDVYAKQRFSHTQYLPQWFLEFNQFFARRKKELNAMDFDDLLLLWLALLKDHPSAAQKWSERFEYILVDEYQDINLLQDEIVQALSSVHHNLLVVGDDAQSIYGFRGANVDHIRAFPRRFPQAKTFPLTINYRSTSEILGLANTALKRHAQAFQKELSAQRGAGESPRLIEPLTLEEEAQWIIDQIQTRVREGLSLNDQAVLFRASASSITLELELQRAGVPYILRGGLRFFEQAHIKDMVATARILNYWADELAWLRFAELLPGVGPAASTKIWALIKSTSQQELNIALDRNPAIKTHLTPVVNHLRGNTADLATQLTDWLNGWYHQYLEDNYDDAGQRYDDCAAFCSFVSRYTDREQLFADIALSEQFEHDDAGAPHQPRLVCSTIHQAKGLEWSVVYLIGLTDGALPHYRSLNSLEELEEERRLLYVAITRAKDHLVFSSAREGIGGQYALPSRFLEELRPSLVGAQELDDEGLPVIDVSGKPIGILDKILLMKKMR